MLTAIIVLSIVVLYLIVDIAVLACYNQKLQKRVRHAVLIICKNCDRATIPYMLGSDLLDLVDKKLKELEFIKK